VIGTDQEKDVLVYEELDDTVFVDITSSKDGVKCSLVQFFLKKLLKEPTL
jgi:hypothetical protein